jgi:hypothetical protein
LRLKVVFLSALISLCAAGAHAQSALEHHAWQNKRSFQPSSRTAQAITGPITLSGGKFAEAGSKTSIRFGRGKPINLTSVGASWQEWEIGDKRQITAEVFRLSQDPGTLLNGNTLCGDPKSNPATYIVFFESSMLDLAPELSMAVFRSNPPPRDINSAGLCGTFGYVIK